MKTLLSTFLLFFLSLTHASDLMSLIIDANQAQFIVTLPANPTTGYQWTVIKYDKSFLQCIGNHYIAPQAMLMGAGGQMQFKFGLVKGKIYPKTTEILFKYARSWEPKTGIMKKVIIKFSNQTTDSD